MTPRRKRPNYMTTYLVAFSAENEAHSRMTAEHIRQQIENLLDEDEGDFVETGETMEFGAQVSPLKDVILLRRARNILLRTRFNDAYEVARSLDQMAHALWLRANPNDPEVEYDHGRLMKIAELVFAGDDPTD